MFRYITVPFSGSVNSQALKPKTSGVCSSRPYCATVPCKIKCCYNGEV